MFRPSLVAPHIQNGKRSPLPDEHRGARLRAFLDAEAYEGNWWAVIRRQDGTLWEETGRQDVPYAPPDDYKAWARDVCDKLNDEVHYNGVWVVVIFSGATRWAFVWKDWDGDIQIFGDDDGLELISRCRITRMLEHADQMILEWMTAVFSNVEVKPEQQVKLAQGEQPTADMVDPALAGH